jgi:mono/diheme cytochrome c family protein
MRRLALVFVLVALPASAAHADEAVRANYLLACRGCHLADGSGVPPDVPSLRNTLGQFASSPAGRQYLVRVPGVLQSRLNDEQLAAVINWVLTEFNADTLPSDFRPLSANEVGEARKQILANPVEYRDKLVRDSAVE